MASSSKEKQELFVLIAGLPRTGKSTALNNIFDLDFPAGRSATPITTRVRSVKTSKNDISLQVTDVPGLTAANITTDSITLTDMKNVGKKNTFLLLLTLPVTQPVKKDYYNILQNLTTIFGPEVWEWCLVLLTFSDDLVLKSKDSSDSEKQKYVDSLKEHCRELQTLLEKTGAKKTLQLFEYADFTKFQDKSVDTIVAIPASKDPTFSTKKLFPQQSWTHEYQWIDLAFMEIAKINETIPQAGSLRSALIQFRYGYFTLKDRLGTLAIVAASGAVGGAAVGAGIGTVTAPGPGTFLGGLIGGVVGGVSGAIGLVSGAAAVIMIAHKIKVNRDRNKAPKQGETTT